MPASRAALDNIDKAVVEAELEGNAWILLVKAAQVLRLEEAAEGQARSN